jgi:hypothetical protein
MILKRQENDEKIRAMYSSSTILASIYERDKKKLTVIFKNGGQYKYSDVSFTDYVRFETADSQGVVLNSHIKKYATEKLENVEVSSIIKEVTELSAVEDKALEVVRVKNMVDTMLKFINNYVINDSVDVNMLEKVEGAITNYKSLKK